MLSCKLSFKQQLLTAFNISEKRMSQESPPLNTHPLSEYVALGGIRNRDPVLSVLKEKLPQTPGHVLEFASGSGMHINYFAPHFKHLRFHPTDKDTGVFDNIKKLSSENYNDNIADPVHLDLAQAETWSNLGKARSFAALFCINFFQVVPISIANAMMECADNLLDENGFLLVYGPFQLEGNFLSDSNKEFHERLRSSGIADWGLKDVVDLKEVSKKHGLELKEQINMPANNFALVFGRRYMNS